MRVIQVVWARVSRCSEVKVTQVLSSLSSRLVASGISVSGARGRAEAAMLAVVFLSTVSRSKPVVRCVAYGGC